MSDLNNLIRIVTQLRDERNWKQFHNPKDLATALSVEASELLEHFLWVSQEESFKVAQNKKEKIQDEMADVLAYLLALADATGIDIKEALENKMHKNRAKYPVEKAHSKTTKYNEL